MKVISSLTIVVLAASIFPRTATADCSLIRERFKDRPNGTIFYYTNNGIKAARNGQKLKGLVGKSVFLLRKGIHPDSAGGVLVVKIGRNRDNAEATVTLRSKFVKKQIIRCKQNVQLRQRLDAIHGSKVSYEQFQAYVLRPAASRLSPSVKKQLDDLHFAYKGSIDVGNTCNRWTNEGGNLRQHSLVASDTGGTTLLDNLARGITSTALSFTGYANNDYDWTVRMIPYDRNRNRSSSTACITITAPEFVGARVLRINDLEERVPGTRRSDGNYDNKHFGDRNFSR